MARGRKKATTLNSTPPAAREASAREIIAFLKAKGQVGCPSSITTDAQLGYSEMARQSAEIPFCTCGRDGSILVRLEGSPTRQGCVRARVAYSPCCAKATHIAVPARCDVGEFPNKKAHCAKICSVYFRQAVGSPSTVWALGGAIHPYTRHPPLFEN